MTVHEQKLQTDPPVIIDRTHYERLSDIANAAIEKNPNVAERLLEEIERADVREPSDMPPNVVNLGSQVTYVDESNGTSETVYLVWPNEADIEKKQVSVLTPIGAALIGLTENASLDWLTNDGRVKILKIVSVKN